MYNVFFNFFVFFNLISEPHLNIFDGLTKTFENVSNICIFVNIESVLLSNFDFVVTRRLHDRRARA